MMVLSIPEMHKHLEDLNHFYNERTSSFVSLISSHPGQFTPADAREFSGLIEEIRRDALGRIGEFFNAKFGTRSELYDSEVLVAPLRSQTILIRASPCKSSSPSLGRGYREQLFS